VELIANKQTAKAVTNVKRIMAVSPDEKRKGCARF